MNEFDDVKVRIGDEEVDAEIKGVDIENEFPEGRSPGEQPENLQKNFTFSVKIEDISEELENWILYGDPEGPESIEAYNIGRFDAGEVQEVTIDGSVLENKMRDIAREEIDDAFLEEEPIPDIDEDKIRDRMIEYHRDKDGDPTTGEVADIVGEPREDIRRKLQALKARGVMESYPIGRSEKWRIDPLGEWNHPDYEEDN